MSKIFVLSLKALIFLGLGLFLLIQGEQYFSMPSAVRHLIVLQCFILFVLKLVELRERYIDNKHFKQLLDDSEYNSDFQNLGS